MSRAERPQGAPLSPRALRASGRSAAEDLDGGKIWSEAAARKAGLPIRPGKFFCRTGWERCPRALALKETCRDGLCGKISGGRPRGLSPRNVCTGPMGGGPAALKLSSARRMIPVSTVSGVRICVEAGQPLPVGCLAEGIAKREETAVPDRRRANPGPAGAPGGRIVQRSRCPRPATEVGEIDDGMERMTARGETGFQRA